MINRKQGGDRSNVVPPSMSTREMYGREIRYQRERMGMSQEELGDLLFLSRSQVTRMELGTRRIQPGCAEMLDTILNTGDYFVRNLDGARATPYPEHFADVAELEGLAEDIREWGPVTVPGLLQTEAYASAIIRGWDPVLADPKVKERVMARLARALIFANADNPRYRVILDEAVLRRPVGGPAVMAEQLRHLIEMVKQSRILLQVLPFNGGAHAGMDGALKLMKFEEDAPMAYLPGLQTGTLVDDPAAVKRFHLAYDLLGAAALSPKASLTLIEAVAEEYEHGTQVRPDGGDLA
ncbi:helix-turn-helix domain-containing protein [Streptomyces sp. CA-111067]|uniref:helix-turn-helix domain-containing protein n=1 Tax=Streptomyces sp. CA-111067 TaxID=3240046 RepID=UPI003D975B34